MWKAVLEISGKYSIFEYKHCYRNQDDLFKMPFSTCLGKKCGLPQSKPLFRLGNWFSQKLECFFSEIRFQLLRSETQNFPRCVMFMLCGKILCFTSQQLKPNLWKKGLQSPPRYLMPTSVNRIILQKNKYFFKVRICQECCVFTRYY